jgi:hypothetical protein
MLNLNTLTLGENTYTFPDNKYRLNTITHKIERNTGKAWKDLADSSNTVTLNTADGQKLKYKPDRLEPQFFNVPPQPRQHQDNSEFNFMTPPISPTIHFQNPRHAQLRAQIQPPPEPIPEFESERPTFTPRPFKHTSPEEQHEAVRHLEETRAR